LLMHNPRGMFEQAIMKVRKPGQGVKYDPKEEAEKGAYRVTPANGDSAKTPLCLREAHVLGNLERAAMSFKLEKSRSSAAQTVKATVMIEPQEIPLTWKGKPIKDYDIQIDRVVVPPRRGASVPRARARINNWEAELHMKYNPELGLPPHQVIEILKRGGNYVGLLDWRPRYGTFDVAETKITE